MIAPQKAVTGKLLVHHPQLDLVINSLCTRGHHYFKHTHLQKTSDIIRSWNWFLREKVEKIASVWRVKTRHFQFLFLQPSAHFLPRNGEAARQGVTSSQSSWSWLTAWWPFSSNRLNMMADIMFDDVNMIEMMIKIMFFLMISQDESSSWFFMMFHVNVTDHHPIFEGKTEWFHYKNTAQLVSSHHNKKVALSATRVPNWWNWLLPSGYLT